MQLFSILVRAFASVVLGFLSFVGVQQPTPYALVQTKSHVIATSSIPEQATSPTPAKNSSPTQASGSVVQKVTPVAAPTTLPTAQPAPQQSSPAVSAQTIADVNVALRASLVNILCTTGAGGYFYPISGSGVIIDTRGVILTNAHVGQYFLLRDYPTPDNVTCVVRTGSPATAAYNARLIYLPPAWIDANASQIKSTTATGTGENDYAFLLITSSVSGAALPTSFPALTLSTDIPTPGDEVVLAAYPAQYLGGAIIQQNLYASSAVTTVQALYTFSTIASPVDAISLGSSIVSQEGSSGGAVARAQDGVLLGIIATETTGTTTADRELRAITLGHIDRSLAQYGQGGIATLLSGDVQAEADTFNQTIAPDLTQKLIDALK